MKVISNNNLWQKGLALFVALLIWALAPIPKKEGQTESQFFIPISYVNMPKQLELVGSPLQSVSVSVSVLARDVNKIGPSLFQMSVDLSDMSVGKNVVNLDAAMIKAPKEVKILRVNPSNLDLTFEESIEKVLSIHPVLVGETGKGYVVHKVVMNPDQVLVHGPASKLLPLKQLETKAINIDKLNGTIEMVAKVLYPTGIRAVPPEPDFFSARVVVGSKPMTINFRKIPIGLVNQVYVTRLNPKTFNLKIRGPRSLVENLQVADIQAFIDLARYKPGTYKIKTPTMRLHPDIKIIKTWPPIDLWVLNQTIYE